MLYQAVFNYSALSTKLQNLYPLYLSQFPLVISAPNYPNFHRLAHI